MNPAVTCGSRFAVVFSLGRVFAASSFQYLFIPDASRRSFLGVTCLGSGVSEIGHVGLGEGVREQPR